MFKQSGFDSVISKGTVLSGDVIIPVGSTLQLDGTIINSNILVSNNELQGDKFEKAESKTKLILNGKILAEDKNLDIENVEISGELKCNELRVETLLTIKSSAKITVGTIMYREIKLEPGAVILATLKHLDYVSAGEIT